MRFFRIALIAAILQIAAPVESSLSSIDGVVVQEGTGIPQAMITVELLGGPGGVANPQTTTTTDSNGKFRFQNLRAGRYRVMAVGPGGLRTEYGQRSAGASGLPIVLEAGKKIEDIRIALTATAALSGRVRDSDGEPAPGTEVRLIRSVYQSGGTTLALAQQTLTNDRGEYRFFEIPPGPYYISAVLPDVRRSINLNVLSPGGPGTSDSSLPRFANQLGTAVNVPTYYPGVRDAASAERIDLSAGESHGGAELKLIPPLRAYRLRGAITNATGQGTLGSVRLSPVNPFPLSTTAALNTNPDRATGEFELAGIVPGAYHLSATLAQETFRDAPPSACIPISVVSSDVENVRVVISPGFSVSGRVVVDGGSAGSLLELAREVRLVPDTSERSCPANPVAANPAADGSFTLENVMPGTYFVRVSSIQPTNSSAPRNGYVKLAQLGSVDILNRAVRLDGAPGRLVEIVVGANTGTITGRVVADKLQPAANVVVVLVPDAARRSRGDLYRSASTDAAGRFQIPGLRPETSNYLPGNRSRLTGGPIPNSSVCMKLEGDSIRVDENSRQDLEIPLIPAVK